MKKVPELDFIIESSWWGPRVGDSLLVELSVVLLVSYCVLK